MAFLSAAKDREEERISLDETYITHPNSTYFMRMGDLSMINAFIPPGSLLVVDRSVIPKNMDIVVAAINGSLYVRYLEKNDHRVKLLPANSKHRELPVTAEMNMVIWGVVIAVVTEPRKLDVHVRAS